MQVERCGRPGPPGSTAVVELGLDPVEPFSVRFDDPPREAVVEQQPALAARERPGDVLAHLEQPLLFVEQMSRPADAPVLPRPAGPPTPEEAARLTAVAAEHGIEILGPPGMRP
jgi:hypothetical protein